MAENIRREEGQKNAWFIVNGTISRKQTKDETAQRVSTSGANTIGRDDLRYQTARETQGLK
jgi:hypothetical protein